MKRNVSSSMALAGALLLGIATLALHGCAQFGRAAQNRPEAGLTSQYRSVMDFGARRDGKTDDTAAIQKAIDSFTSGGTVYMPEGHYLVAGSINVKPGVAVMGAFDAPASIDRLSGTVILATGGRGQEEGAPLFSLGKTSMVRALMVYYPEQKANDIQPYPWTFQLQDFDNTVENITLINSYQGIRTGPNGNGRHRIRSVVGCVLRRGILVDHCGDIGRVENVQFHCHWWSDKALGGDWDLVLKYMAENLEAFIFARTDWEYVTNNFVLPAKIGFHFIQGATGCTNGQFSGNGVDHSQTCIQVDQIQHWGLLFSGCELVAAYGPDPVQVRVSPGAIGNVRFTNSSFWGPANHNAVLDGENFVTFSDCFFSSISKITDDHALVVANSGRLQVNGCTFGTAHPSIVLGSKLIHALVEGNNGTRGVRIVNNAPKSIIANNEEPLPMEDLLGK